MKYLLDTHSCIDYVNGYSSQLRVKLGSTPREDVGVSSVTKAELYHNAAWNTRQAHSQDKLLEFLEILQSVPFDDAAAEVYGQVRADLERAGMTLGAYDMQIAAVAMARSLTLVTPNGDIFRNIDGLKIEDWERA